MFRNSALSLLSNQKLIEIYKNAIILKLDKEFIVLLAEEMHNRGFTIEGSSSIAKTTSIINY
ncbi:MAG: sporulation histidine kinase inhibitor Sda [Anaerobacillus sp.]|uniref:sporulation histidine kinase inhibitor Sda n=1 Tax=Anaerobacillus sp. TaxID=1872506 RepID=UPI003919DA76